MHFLESGVFNRVPASVLVAMYPTSLDAEMWKASSEIGSSVVGVAGAGCDCIQATDGSASISAAAEKTERAFMGLGGVWTLQTELPGFESIPQGRTRH